MMDDKRKYLKFRNLSRVGSKKEGVISESRHPDALARRDASRTRSMNSIVSHVPRRAGRIQINRLMGKFRRREFLNRSVELT